MKIVSVDLHSDHIKRNSEWIKVAKELYDAQQMKKHFTSIALSLSDKLKKLSNNENSKGGEFLYTAIMTKGGVEYSLIPELQNVDLEQYRKESTMRWKLSKI